MTNPNINYSKNGYNERVGYVMSQFDFKKVHECMKLIGWEYKLLSDDGYIPSIKMLQTTVIRLFKDIWDNETTNISSGGFDCGVEDNELYINFTLESASTDV